MPRSTVLPSSGLAPTLRAHVLKLVHMAARSTRQHTEAARKRVAYPAPGAPRTPRTLLVATSCLRRPSGVLCSVLGGEGAGARGRLHRDEGERASHALFAGHTLSSVKRASGLVSAASRVFTHPLFCVFMTGTTLLKRNHAACQCRCCHQFDCQCGSHWRVQCAEKDEHRAGGKLPGAYAVPWAGQVGVRSAARCGHSCP